MKFQLTFKTPDVMDKINDDITQHVLDLSHDDELDDEQTESLHYDIENECRELLDKFLNWGECLAVEFDTENGTATVVRQR